MIEVIKNWLNVSLWSLFKVYSLNIKLQTNLVIKNFILEINFFFFFAIYFTMKFIKMMFFYIQNWEIVKISNELIRTTKLRILRVKWDSQKYSKIKYFIKKCVKYR